MKDTCFDGRWQVTVSAVHEDGAALIRFSAVCLDRNLQTQFEVPPLEALRHALAVLKAYGDLHPEISAQLGAHVQGYEKDVIERFS